MKKISGCFLHAENLIVTEVEGCGETKRGYNFNNKRDMKKFITKKTKRCYKVCMVEFGKKQKCLKTCGIKNRSKCKFSRDGLHDIRNLNEFVCE